MILLASSPIIAFEFMIIITFGLFFGSEMGTQDIKEFHKVAWRLDLSVWVLVLSCLILAWKITFYEFQKWESLHPESRAPDVHEDNQDPDSESHW